MVGLPIHNPDTGFIFDGEFTQVYDIRRGTADITYEDSDGITQTVIILKERERIKRKTIEKRLLLHRKSAA